MSIGQTLEPGQIIERRVVYTSPGNGDREITRTGNERQCRKMLELFAEVGARLEHRVITVGEWTEGEPPTEDDDDGD